MFLEQAQAFEQQIAEIGSVEFLEPFLVGGIELRALAIGKREGLALGHFVRGQSAVLPVIDQSGELPCRPTVFVDPFGLDDLFEKTDLVIGIEDRKAGLEIDQFVVTTQDTNADGMKCAEPRHAFDGLSDILADTLLHFARGLVRERHGEDLRRICRTGRKDMCDPRRKNPRLAGAGAREHEQGPFERFDGIALFRVQPLEIGRRRRCRQCPLRNTLRRGPWRLSTCILFATHSHGFHYSTATMAAISMTFRSTSSRQGA